MKVIRHFALALAGLGAWVVFACQKSGESGSRPPPQAKPSQATVNGAAAWKTDISKVCELPSFRPAALKQNLGIVDSVGGREPSSFSRTHVKCMYSSKAQVTVEVDRMAGSNLGSARRMFENVPGTLKDYPGFGDEAFVFTVPLGTQSFHSLVVLKEGIMMVSSAIAEVEAIRKATALLYQDMGIAI